MDPFFLASFLMFLASGLVGLIMGVLVNFTRASRWLPLEGLLLGPVLTLIVLIWVFIVQDYRGFDVLLYIIGTIGAVALSAIVSFMGAAAIPGDDPSMDYH